MLNLLQLPSTVRAMVFFGKPAEHMILMSFLLAMGTFHKRTGIFSPDIERLPTNHTFELLKGIPLSNVFANQFY